MSTPPLLTLEIDVLGAPQIKCGGITQTQALSVKAQALVYYLAMSGRPLMRATAAALL